MEIIGVRPRLLACRRWRFCGLGIGALFLTINWILLLLRGQATAPSSSPMARRGDLLLTLAVAGSILEGTIRLPV